MSLTINDIAAAGERKLAQLDAISHNLANVSTPGFKAIHLTFMEEAAGATVPDGQTVTYGTEMAVDYSQGQLDKTGNPLDVAIGGAGFFCIETQAGPVYTRRGDFAINQDRELVTMTGERVLGESGPIVLTGNSVQIDEGGVVRCGDTLEGRLKIVDFTDKQALVPVEGGLLQDPGDAGLKVQKNATVHAGYLERSNVGAIREMTAMIEVQRAFETYQKMIQAMSEQDKLATARVGKLI